MGVNAYLPGGLRLISRPQLELNRTDVTYRRMSSLRIVEFVDVVADGRPRFGTRGIALVIEELPFDGGEEAFSVLGGHFQQPRKERQTPRPGRPERARRTRARAPPRPG